MGRTGRSIAWISGCALALVIVLYVHGTGAVGPRLRILSANAAPCPGGDPAPVVVRGQPLTLHADGFTANAPLVLAITFADGRVFDAGQRDASAPTDPFDATTDATGAATLALPTAASWPPGCYMASAIGGTESARARFVLHEQPSGPRVVGRASVRIVNQANQQPSGVQGESAIVMGSGFRSNDALVVTIVAPDGTLLAGPILHSDAVGRVALSYRFDEGNAPGTYDVVVTGSNGARANAQFRLRPLPTTVQGNGLLRIVEPFPARVAQEQPFQLRGEQFAPNENVRLIAIQPNGGRVVLATTASDELGTFQADATLGIALPTGVYLVVAEGADSGTRAVARLALRAADVTQFLAAPAPTATPESLLPTLAPAVAPPAPTLPDHAPPVFVPLPTPSDPLLPATPSEPLIVPSEPATNPLPTPPF